MSNEELIDKTTPLSSYGQPITYFGVAYTFTKEDNDGLTSIDKAIQKRLKDIIYFTPDGSRHITIMNVTVVAESYKDHGVMQFFEDNIELYRDKLKTIAIALAHSK
jgi:hypothetical protein